MSLQRRDCDFAIYFNAGKKKKTKGKKGLKREKEDTVMLQAHTVFK